MAFNIWERWPWTSFQNLNLDWLMKAVKTAYTKAEEAFNKASAVENEVGTYTDQINAAVLTANQAMQIARNANEILFISADTENKAVNYVTWSQGGTGYVTAADIYNAIVVDHKMPVFMDRMQYIYEMAGYETDPDSPLTITRFKFTKNGGNREDVVWIDGTGSITYTHIDGSANGVPVVFNYIPPNPQVDEETVRWVSDTTYSEILTAINSGRSICLTIKIDGETREIINNAYIYKSATATFIVLGYSKGINTDDSPYYTDTGNYLVYYTINSNNWISVGRVHTVPSSSTAITGRVLTVNSSGHPEWMPASGGDTSGAVLYNTAQNLPAAYKEQAQNNIGIHDKIVLAGSIIPSLSPGVFYDILGQRSSIEITLSSPTYPGDANEYHVRFRTAAAPAESVIILPSSVHVPVGFGVRQVSSTDTAFILSPSTVYEISILDDYLSFQVWEG